MLTDEEINYLNREILAIYQDMELDLIIDIARRFDTYEKIGGSLEWHLKKLDELGALNRETVKIIARYSTRSEKAIRKMLKEASFANFDRKTLDRAGIDLETMMQSPAMAATFEHSYQELKESFKMIQTAAQESVRQSYMTILNTAYLETASGVYSYGQSISRAMQKMANKGIYGATYKRSNPLTGEEKIIHYSIEAAVRRDTLTAVHQTANRAVLAAAEDNGVNALEISSHLGARVSDTNPIANHAGWQGKVYLIEGSSEEYPNFVESTGYGDIQGFAGVNCRHRAFLFWPGISKSGQAQIDLQENRQRRELLDQQRAMERTIRQYKRRRAAAEQCNDLEGFVKADRKVKEKQKQLIRFCNDHSLPREFEREQIAS